MAVLTIAAVALIALAAPAFARFSSIVIDHTTGTMLEDTDSDALRYPASLTKMMTLYLIFDALANNRIQLTTRWPVSAHASRQAPTKLGLRPGQTISVQEVILGLITKSANDAAVVAPEALGGSEPGFAMMMTARARQLGMASTTYQNASGLPNTAQVTTARDQAMLARSLIRDFPQYYGYFSTDDFLFRGRRIANHNRLMNWYPGADGLKTGYIRASGYNLAFSAVRDGRRLVGVVMGGNTARARDLEMARIFDASFARAATLPPAREAVAQRPALVATPAPSEEAAEPNARAPRGRVQVTAPAPAAARAAARSWGIQVGAFSTLEQSRAATDRAMRLSRATLANASVDLSSSETNGQTVYRARLMGLSEEQARQTCRALARHRMACQAVVPDDTRVAQR